MRILLIQSPTGRPEVPIYPLGLAYLGGQLKNHELRGLDLSLETDTGSALEEVLGSFEPEVTAVSLRNIDDSAYPETYSYLPPFTGIIRRLEDYGGTVVVGGTGFSIYPEIVLQRYPRIDYGLPGEGEVIFPRLIQHLTDGAAIEGWDGGRILPAVQSDLWKIAPPDYGLFDVRNYTLPDAIGVQSRRGCAFSCSYCTYSFLSGSSFRTRPTEQVLGDIRVLQEKGVKRFQFVDSVFNAPEKYFLKLLSALEDDPVNIEWSAWVDERITPEQLERMRAAGAVKVDISPDAITDRGLRLICKRSSARELLPAVRAARKAGLQVGVNFFNGNPGEGFIAFLRKILFMLRVRLTCGWRDTFVNLGTIRVYAHSPLAESMREKGMVEGDCDFFEPVFFRKRGLSDWAYRLYRKIRGIRHGR